MMVTEQLVLIRRFATASPPKPQPMITTCFCCCADMYLWLGAQPYTFVQNIPRKKSQNQHEGNDNSISHTHVDVRNTQKTVAEGVDHVQHWVNQGYFLPKLW